MSLEAMKQALKALEQVKPLYDRHHAIVALRQAIEQAEKLPPWKDSASDYERGFIDGMQKQMQSSVDKAINAMSKREWVGLTDEELAEFSDMKLGSYDLCLEVEAKLKDKNSGKNTPNS
jgi:hypothetical protein